VGGNHGAGGLNGIDVSGNVGATAIGANSAAASVTAVNGSGGFSALLNANGGDGAGASLTNAPFAMCEWRVHSPQKWRLKIPQFS
jgi:hypothetical protein